MAALDAVLSPDWEERVFSYDPEWSDDERMGSMDNGSGNTYQHRVRPTPAWSCGASTTSRRSARGATTSGTLAPGILDGFPRRTCAR